MAIRDCGYIPSECFSRFCPYYLTGKTQQSPAFLWSRPPRLQWAPSRDRKLGQQWPPVCQGAQRFTAGVFLSFFMTCILKLVLYICLLCVCAHACMHARAFTPQHTHGGQRQLVESRLFLPWVSMMELRSQTLLASILTCRIISSVPQYILRQHFSLNLSSPIWYGLAAQWTPGILCLPHPVTGIKGTCCCSSLSE